MDSEMELRQEVDVGLTQPWAVITTPSHIRIIDETGVTISALTHDDVPIHLARALANQRARHAPTTPGNTIAGSLPRHS